MSPERNIDVFARPSGVPAMQASGRCVTAHFRDERLDMCLYEHEARVLHRKLGEALAAFDAGDQIAGDMG